MPNMRPADNFKSQPMHFLTRRNFLKTTTFAAAGAALSARSWGQVVGANHTIRAAVVGLNGRGRSHVKNLNAVPGVRVVALCDVDAMVLRKNAQELGAGVKTYTDIRELLAAPDIDVISVATPNHWHALMGIWACQAGKDVYMEKPISHNIWEGRQFVAAANQSRRVVQAGTQIRSSEGLIEAVAYVRSGQLGKVTAARGFCYKRRPSLGQVTGPQAVPANINYDLWSGPAPLIAPHRNSAKNGPVHYDWHWFWAYGNGDVGNQGIHQMDVARWFLGEAGLPRHTLSVGGRLGYVDDGQTPNTQIIVHDYATAPLIFEVRGLPRADGTAMDKYRGVSIGNVIDCEHGYIVSDSYFAASAYDLNGRLLKEFKGTDRLMQNFIDVVRSRKTAELYGPLEEAHVSSSLCHLGNISHQLGQSVVAGEARAKLQGQPLLAEAHGRMVEHLASNQVDLAKASLTLGVPLAIDAQRERFIGPEAAAANALLTRQYRAPFVVPASAT
jgi:predicted dehydrogenase